jgi:DNA polymerase-1
VLVTEQNYVTAMEHLDKCDALFTDTETSGLDPWAGDRVIGISCKGRGDPRAYYFPIRHTQGNLPLEKVIGHFKPLLTKPRVTYAGFNYGFDLQSLAQDGIPLPDAFEEVSTAAHLMNENERSFKMKDLARKYLEREVNEDEKLKEMLIERGLGKGGMWQLPPEDVEPYACDDVVLTEQLRDFYVPHLQTWKLYDIWREVNEYAHAVVTMECRGLQLDVPLIEQYMAEAEVEKIKALEVMRQLSGDPRISPDTHKRNQRWLRVPTTEREYLEPFVDKIPGVRELLECRGWSKVKGTYYNKFLEFCDFLNRLHANLNIIGTDTGRLSCARPNLQSIPKVGKAWFKVKDVFIVDGEEYVLLEADYSLAELRVGSHYAQEKTMQEKLNRGADLHQETADEAGVPRDDGKRITFSAFYGIGKKTLAERLRIAEKLAGDRLRRWHRLYPGVRRLYNKAQAMAEARGYIRMFTGRMRHYNTPQTETHKASSNLIQGSVAEMIRIAITRLHRELKLDMRLTVHDSIIAQVRKRDVEEVVPEVNRIMTDTPWMTTKNKVDFKVGSTWGGMKKYTTQQMAA